MPKYFANVSVFNFHDEIIFRKYEMPLIKTRKNILNIAILPNYVDCNLLDKLKGLANFLRGNYKPLVVGRMMMMMICKYLEVN